MIYGFLRSIVHALQNVQQTWIIGIHVQQNCNFFQEQTVKLLKLYSLAQRVQLEVIVKFQSLQFQYK